MLISYVVIWGSMVLFGGSAVLALLWAIRTGQMRDFRQAAASIFDNEEPIGRETDYFPEGR
jgi:cbb3-type cytochrome oxidase maturation protein